MLRAARNLSRACYSPRSRRPKVSSSHFVAIVKRVCWIETRNRRCERLSADGVCLFGCVWACLTARR